MNRDKRIKLINNIKSIQFETRNMVVNYGEHNAHIIREVLVAILASHIAQLDKVLDELDKEKVMY